MGLELLAEEKKILNCLIHAEEIRTVVQETGIPAKVVKDVVRSLWHYRYIKAVDNTGKEILLVDADLLHKAKFRLTAKGMDNL